MKAAASRNRQVTWFVIAHLSLPMLAYGTAMAIGDGQEMPPVPVAARSASGSPVARLDAAADAGDVAREVAHEVAREIAGDVARDVAREVAAPWHLDAGGQVSWRTP